ncbi:hypothetical protein GCM10027569_08840 [Flindersiella endophytica]
MFDAHRDDPEFGYRLLGDEARDAGHLARDQTMWRICAANSWWSVFGKNGKRPGPPAHDDLVCRVLTADRPNKLWLTDITEHPTGEGTLYLRPVKCPVKDVCSNADRGVLDQRPDEVPPGCRRADLSHCPPRR